MRSQYITDTDLIPYEYYGLVCQGCDYDMRWRMDPIGTKADVVVKARKQGWMRIDTGSGMRQYCGECAAVIRGNAYGVRMRRGTLR